MNPLLLCCERLEMERDGDVLSVFPRSSRMTAKRPKRRQTAARSFYPSSRTKSPMTRLREATMKMTSTPRSRITRRIRPAMDWAIRPTVRSARVSGDPPWCSAERVFLVVGYRLVCVSLPKRPCFSRETSSVGFAISLTTATHRFVGRFLSSMIRRHCDS